MRGIMLWVFLLPKPILAIDIPKSLKKHFIDSLNCRLRQFGAKKFDWRTLKLVLAAPLEDDKRKQNCFPEELYD